MNQFSKTLDNSKTEAKIEADGVVGTAHYVDPAQYKDKPM
jgi:hypothetical protein